MIIINQTQKIYKYLIMNKKDWIRLQMKAKKYMKDNKKILTF